MLATNRWVTVQSTDLIEAMATRNFDIVPAVPGLYAWRLSLIPTHDVTTSASASRGWLETIANRVSGAFSARRVTTNTTALFSFGGGGLTDEKRQTLERYAKSRAIRSEIVRFATSLHDIAAPLYIGQASDLQVRLRQHLRGETDFAETLRDDYRLTFEDLYFEYYAVAESKSHVYSDYLELLELLAHRVVAPLGVKRSG